MSDLERYRGDYEDDRRPVPYSDRRRPVRYEYQEDPYEDVYSDGQWDDVEPRAAFDDRRTVAERAEYRRRPVSTRTIAKVVVGSLALGGVVYIGAKIWDGMPECFKASVGLSNEGLWDACTPNWSMPNGKDSSAEFSSLNIVKEDLTGDTNIEVFGEASAQVGSDKQSTFTFEDSRWYKDYWGIDDAKLYWNQGGKNTTEVRYNICITKGKTDVVRLEAPTDPAAEPKKPADGQPAGIRYELKTDEKGRPVKLDIKAGYLDVCFPRIPNTQHNEAMWTFPHADHFWQFWKENPAQFGGLEAATFRWQQNQLILDQVLADACPESFVNMDNLKEHIATQILGEIALDHPESATVLANIRKNGLYEVHLASAAERQAVYRKKLEDDRKKILAMDHTIPDLNNGRTEPLETPDFGAITTRQCGSMTTPAAVKAAQ